jgi:hypothetical protein
VATEKHYFLEENEKGKFAVRAKGHSVQAGCWTHKRKP